MYTFTIENFNEDTNKLEYLTFEVFEGDSFFDRSMDCEVMLTCVEADGRVIGCKDGNGENEEWAYSDNELARYFQPVSIEVCA